MDLELTQADIGALVEQFYATVRTDPLIGPFFEEAVEDWDAHLTILTRFWCSVALGSRTYRGNPLRKLLALEGGIRPEFFDRWMAIWAETTDEVIGGAAALELRQVAGRIADSLKFVLFLDPARALPAKPE